MTLLRRGFLAGAILAAVLGLVHGCSGSGSSDVSTSAGGSGAVDAGRPDAADGGKKKSAPCTEDWCADLDVFCKRAVTVCPNFFPFAASFTPAQILAGCTPGHGGVLRIRFAGKEAATAKALGDCGTKAMSCEDIWRCREPIFPEDGVVGPDGGGEEAPSFPVPAPTPDPKYVSLPAGVQLLPFDSVKCVRCAVDQCASVSNHCFVSSGATPGCFASGKVDPLGVPDCCVDYRRCLQACRQQYGNSIDDFITCGEELCNKSYPRGATEFRAYKKCFDAKCAGCAT